METLKYLALAAILFGSLVSLFIVDWKDKKTYRNVFITLSVIAAGTGFLFLIDS